MASIPALRGLMKRRILVNYRVEPSAIDGLVPPPFELRLVRGKAMAGVCLIRLEHLRSAAVQGMNVGLTSENAAYRVAVAWPDPASGEARRGVYIARRDTSSALQHALGGRLFPGQYCRSRFEVSDREGRIAIRVCSEDGKGDLELRAQEVGAFLSDSVFGSLDEASRFYREAALGYSASRGDRQFEGLCLRTADWEVRPLAIEAARSALLDGLATSPGSVKFDNALILRDLDHEWHPVPPITTEGWDRIVTKASRAS
jgi:uncharacterized protein YqjF (DUF2071 family)